ncbi:MAG: DUF3159 domain-containing protein [Sporichthyaceae bacterium]
MSSNPAAAAATTTQVDASTVEEVVRHRLSAALGGRRGMVEGAVPTLGFTLTFLISHELRLALTLGIGLAVVLLVVRVVQRQPVQFVVNSLVGIGIAAVFAARTGKAEDVFLPGIIYNAAYAGAFVLSILVRWPLVGLMIASVTGDLTAWRTDPAIVRLCSRLTWLLAVPCVIRVAVQYPLYLAGEVGWLGVTKIALGWPLQVASLAAMAWLLSRNSTPMRTGAHAFEPAVEATSEHEPEPEPAAAEDLDEVSGPRRS